MEQPGARAVSTPGRLQLPSWLGRLLAAVVDVLVAAILAAVVLIAAGIVGNPLYRIIAVEGGSMEPAISRGDLIVVVPAPSKIEAGMVVVMTMGGEVVTHRVVAINADGTFVTRGDANPVDDPWTSDQVRVDGMYVATIPWLGRILPAVNASGAAFADGVSAVMRIVVGVWATPPTPAQCSDMAFADVIVGTAEDDTIDAGNGGVLVFGLAGNDTITGGNGKDCLVGGDGDDELSGGNGKDVLLGADGDDTLSGGGGGDTLEGGDGTDLLHGDEGVDTCAGTGDDILVDCEATPADRPIEPGSTPGPSPAPGIDPDASASPPADGGPGPTPGPGASSSPEPDPGPSPTPNADGSPSPQPTPDPTPAPTPAPTPEPTPAPTPDPTPTPKPPTADFSFSIAGLTVSFTNQSRNAETWTWDFGDGTTSGRRNPDHTYGAEGTYTVKLEVRGTDDSTASTSADVTVAP